MMNIPLGFVNLKLAYLKYDSIDNITFTIKNNGLVWKILFVLIKFKKY